MLRETGDRIDMQIGIARRHRAGFGHGKGSAQNREIDIGQILRLARAANVALPAISARWAHTILAPRGCSSGCERNGLEAPSE